MKNYYETDYLLSACGEKEEKRGTRVTGDDSTTCLARLPPRDPRILQNHGGQLCKRLFGASVPAGSTGLNRNRVVQPTPSDRKLVVGFRIETVPRHALRVDYAGQFEY